MDYQGNNLRDFLENNGHVVLQRVNNYNLRSFTEKEIEHITNGYSNLLGKGAFGEVYKGVLDGQCLVAVKKYKDGMRKEEFAKEVIVHSQINHKNVARLLGCCTEENSLMIVMEFICNGTLSNILHCSNANGHAPFPLDKRLDIAIELAEVLSCLHSMYSPVLHGDIKPANILLDEDLMPKLSDFGIARLLSTNEAQQTRNIVGSIGYLDPLFIQTGFLTPKSDVYSFGVVLVEMITRKEVADGNVNLIQNFTKSFERGKAVKKMFDAEIVDGKKKIKVLEDIAKLAVDCLRSEGILRPEMVDVADKLRKCRKDLELRGMGEKTGPPGNSRWRIQRGAWGGWSPPYPHAVHGSPHKPPQHFSAMREEKEEGKKEEEGNERREEEENEHPLSTNSRSAPGNSFLPVQPTAPIPVEPTSKDPPIPVLNISLTELREITRNFSYGTLIGEGSHAKIFLGKLKDGRKSAVKMLGQNPVVKKLDGFFSEPDEAFILQVQAVSRLKHDNVVQLLGYCVDENVRAIIYEYSSWSSLHDILQGENGAIGNQPGRFLSWAQRVKITLSAAQGIEFLHHKTESCIIHSDIKSSNILLFDNDVAKIGNLRVSKNRPGYLDDIILDGRFPPYNGYDAPECKKTGKFTREGDMYSFGVVLLELLTGQMIGAMPRLSEMQRSSVDPRLRGKYPPEAATKMAAIASRCMQSEADSRPNMRVVVNDLRSLLLLETMPK